MSEQNETGSNDGKKKNRRILFWILGGIVVVALVLTGFFLLSPKPGSGQIGSSTATSSSSPTSKATSSPASTPSASATSSTGCATGAADAISNAKATITSGNTAALESWAANPVRLIMWATEYSASVTPTEAATKLSSFLSGQTGWRDMTSAEITNIVPSSSTSPLKCANVAVISSTKRFVMMTVDNRKITNILYGIYG